MKTLRLALAVILAVGFAACGEEEDTTDGGITDGGVTDAAVEQFTLAAGTYDLTNVTITKTGCELNAQQVPTPATIKLVGTTYSIDDWGGKPSGTLTGNTLTLRANYDYDNGSAAGNCIESLSKKVDGTLIGDDEFTGTFTYSSATKSGTCNLSTIGYDVPCEAIATFTAKKRPGT